LAVTPQIERCPEPFPFAAPAELDSGLQRLLTQSSELLCRWLATAEQRSPLPALSVMPAVEPEERGLPSDRLLADLQLVMEGAYNPNHPGAIAHLAESQLRRSEMGRAGREGVEGRSWATVMDELLDHYHRALGRTARGREAA
jgi:hypothetical protein